MDSQRGVSFWYVLLGILLIIIIGYWLFANPIIKWILEDKISEAYGAEVNIGQVNHSLIPVTATLYEIQLTDHAKPNQNKVQIGEASADVEVLPLFSDQVVLSKLNLLDVKFAQPRQFAGAVIRPPEESVSFKDIKADAKEAIPTIDELMARSELKSTQAAARAEKRYQQYNDSLKENYQALPDKARINQYEEQIEKLKNADYKSPQAFAKAKQTLDKIKQNIKQDRARISAFTEEAKEARKALKSSLSDLKQAPVQDYDLLKGAFTGDQAAMQRISHMVFGDKAEQMTEYLTSATQIILPLLKDDKKDQNTQADIPSVWVKEAYVSVEFLEQRLASEWKNITNTHPLVGEPTTYSISANGTKFKQFESNGQFWLDDEGVDAQQQWTLEGINLSGIPFLKTEKLSALLKSAMLASSGHFKVQNNAVSGDSTVNLSELAMQAEGKNQLTTSIANVLQQLDQLKLNLEFSGQVDNPSFNISSDLDNRFAQLALTELTLSQQDKLDELKQKLTAMVSGDQKQINKSLKDINTMLETAKGNTDNLQELLQAQLADLVDKQKSKLFDKLKDKLGKNE
ncbi:TIGR03545 family protein [Alteromonas sp. ASW11-130]|uniref:TIGR03545 family protein n=1 Tax=Alteromonas sp. ASW11-130 TaxID=3015775 RepID=UPI002242037E|nr:TIGR03545 family protein [Alteromonas sp. ASW11-130]MCW8091883.1 TIGR03545 family protein [Alteromonas sp. ASW11-130]